ncbi:hypothetical protein NEDG_01819 [Nematocida displodere]|uniref:C2H2-type domain-containing protein n=1 Tax=Nematocida displodere TaxID=1805483 RepID=A0A177EIN0_9MICR|nr:hypothetical protein NEDG_01819 [Nematocida displodere]
MPKYSCGFADCRKTFPKPSLLELHENTHEDVRPFKCPLCEKAYFKKAHLAVHHQRHHTSAPPAYVCGCGKGLLSKESLARHGDVCGRVFACSFCPKTFVRAHWYVRHVDMHTAPTPKKTTPPKHSCTYCHKFFRAKKNLAAHVLGTHGNHSHACTLCEKKYAYPHSLKKHILTHTPNPDKPRQTLTHPNLNI